MCNRNLRAIIRGLYVNSRAALKYEKKGVPRISLLDYTLPLPKAQEVAGKSQGFNAHIIERLEYARTPEKFLHSLPVHFITRLLFNRPLMHKHIPYWERNLYATAPQVIPDARHYIGFNILVYRMVFNPKLQFIGNGEISKLSQATDGSRWRYNALSLQGTGNQYVLYTRGGRIILNPHME